MKNIVKAVKVNIGWSLLLMGIGLISCQEYLEVVPRSSISDATLWSSKGNADLFLNGIYGSIDHLDWFDPMDNYTDNAIGQHPYQDSRDYVLGLATPSNTTELQQWDQYRNIRKCNLFISKAKASDLDASWKELRIAEARFLRAYFYSLLWTAYGGVPIITDVLNRNTQGEEIFRARATDEATYQFIVDECAAIAEVLPLVPETSRASRGAALTLKAWCELFNASPLKNPGNEVMDLNVYSLFPDHRTLLYEENEDNVEVIFDKAHLGGTSIGSNRAGLQSLWHVDGISKSWHGVNVSQSLVDAYAMANGLPITDPASGYDPQNPYVNREQRFYDNVIYDGSEWLGSTIEMWTGSGTDAELSFTFSGPYAHTVYATRKGIEAQFSVFGRDKVGGADWIIFRYAEVLLGFAEAQNEAVGPDASVYDAVNQVRARVDLPPLLAGLSQDEMRTAIYRERRVEFCFEGKHWYDLIRLKLAEELIPAPIQTMKITKENGVKVYTVIDVGKPEARAFDPAKNYLLPIPQSAIDRNPKLVQNPGYGNN